MRDPNGVTFDPSGNLWVSDRSNLRVLEFNSTVIAPGHANGPNAAFVIGQPDFVTSTYGTTASDIGAPTGLVISPAPATITVPLSATAGGKTITASDSVNTQSPSFTVTTPATTYNPAGGSTGTTITATGLNFLPSSTITLKYDSTTVKTITANTTGGYVTTFVVPGSSIGSHNIVASDSLPHTVTTSTSVTTAIILSPTSGPNGTLVTVTGTNLIPSSTITIKFNGTTVVTTPTTVTSTGTGAFTAKFNVPSSPAGVATVVSSDGVNSPAANFGVTTPSLSLNPASGAGGQTIKATGLNFVPSHAITFKFNGVTITSTPATTSNSTGGFVATLKAPVSLSEINTVTASDGTNAPVAEFDAGAATQVFLSDDHVAVGHSITITGTGFITQHAITFKLGTTAMSTSPTTITTDLTGGFSATVIIPASTAGSKTLTVSDGTNSQSTDITIVAGMTLSPLSGPNGTQVTVTGANFVSNHIVSVRVDEGSNLQMHTVNVTSSAAGAFTTKFTIAGETNPTATFD
ncbi:MAG: hypothetical protein ACRD4E_13595, partial [Bryobacteraceae bacterium]